LPLLGWTWRHGTHQQRLTEHIFKLFNALRNGGLSDTQLLRGALKPTFSDDRVKRL